MSLRPRALAKIRDQLLHHHDNPASALRANTGEANQKGLDAVAGHLRAATLYWATPDMAALAMSAGRQLAAARWAAADRPSPCGLMVFDEGIGMLDSRGVEIPAHAVTWGPGHGGDCVIALFASRWELAARLPRGVELLVNELPPLLPLQSFHLPSAHAPASMADLPPGAPASILSALAASWRLMQQPQLVDRTRERPDQAVARAYARAQRPAPEVTIVDLRRQYVPTDGDRSPEGNSRYRHRWVVSGAWRTYKDERYSQKLRDEGPWWIPAHVKGPDGAPLLSTEKVNVWRR